MTDFYDSRFESTPRIGLVGKVGSQARECKWRLFFTFEAWSEQAVDFMNGYLELQPHSSKKDTNDVATIVMAIKQKKTKIMTRRRKKNKLACLAFLLLLGLRTGNLPWCIPCQGCSAGTFLGSLYAPALHSLFPLCLLVFYPFLFFLLPLFYLFCLTRTFHLLYSPLIVLLFLLYLSFHIQKCIFFQLLFSFYFSYFPCSFLFIFSFLIVGTYFSSLFFLNI